MEHSEFLKLVDFARINDQLIAVDNHLHLINDMIEGEVVTMKRVNPRDVKLHRAYFAFNSYIYHYLPNSFQKQIPLRKFYKFLQTMKGDYEVLFRFKDGRELLEYHSISFTKMDENSFRTYIKNQIPYIYENVIKAFYKDEQANDIIDNIEQEFEKFFTKLYAK